LHRYRPWFRRIDREAAAQGRGGMRSDGRRSQLCELIGRHGQAVMRREPMAEPVSTCIFRYFRRPLHASRPASECSPASFASPEAGETADGTSGRDRHPVTALPLFFRCIFSETTGGGKAGNPAIVCRSTFPTLIARTGWCATRQMRLDVLA